MTAVLAGHTATQLTATAGTAITCLIPPRKRAFTRLTSVLYRCAGTAHTVSLMKAFSRTTLAAAAAASATTVVLSANPGTGTPAGAIANGDWIAIKLDDGSFFIATVTVSGLSMTVAALPAAAAAGNDVFFFGVPGDHTSTQTNPKPNPIKGSQIVCTASVLNSWTDPAAGLCQSLEQYSPLMVHSNNATAAGTFELISAVYSSN